MKKIKREKVVRWLPHRKKNTYKNKLGTVLCIGGNEEMGGAIILSAKAALYSGAGLVTVASDPKNRSALHAQLAEVMFTDYSETDDLIKAIQASDTILLGPGLGRDAKAKRIFTFVLKEIEERHWLILDADALYFYAEFDPSFQINTHNILLTPHLGEWERLSNIPAPADQIEKNQAALEKLGTNLVLKKARTEIYFPNAIWKNTAGNPSMATGGMGDTLAGMIAGFLGQYSDKEKAILSA
ncbi:MAG: NAD(P)H-hydrate dehydratase, partial [Atopostipes sp.]|nr:NAD(P)H-hydrate dehydratase [Atopostipes sp.]